MSSRDPGWYPHPEGGIGYYNGTRWTEHRPAPRPPAITRPSLGWVLVAIGGFVAVGAFLPWVTGLRGVISRNGFDGGRDGSITLVLGLALAAVGVAIGLRQGYIWAPILAAVISAASFGVFVIDYNDVNSHKHVSVGSGLWLTGIAAILGLVIALAGLAVRRR